MSAKKTLQIALPVPLPGCFDYLYPGTTPPARGSRVQVPFGRRTLVGLVHGHGLSDHPKLKAIQRVLDDSPVLPEELYRLCERAARYYHHPLGEVLSYALPALLRQGNDAEASQENAGKLPNAGSMSVTTSSAAPRDSVRLCTPCATTPKA